MGEIWGEIQGRYWARYTGGFMKIHGGDTGEMQGRCKGGFTSTSAASCGVEVSSLYRLSKIERTWSGVGIRARARVRGRIRVR